MEIVYFQVNLEEGNNKYIISKKKKKHWSTTKQILSPPTGMKHTIKKFHSPFMRRS